jgi:hypothetical protein
MKTSTTIGLVAAVIIVIAVIWYFKRKKADPNKSDGPVSARGTTELPTPGEKPIESRSAVDSPVARGSSSSSASSAGFQTPLNTSVKGSSSVVELMDAQGNTVILPAGPRTTPVNATQKGDWQSAPRPNLAPSGTVPSGTANVKVFTKTGPKQ